MIINSEIVQAYSSCRRKAFLLLQPGNPAAIPNKPHDYVRMLEQRKGVNRAEFIGNIGKKSNSVHAYETAALEKEFDFLINPAVKSENMEAACDVLMKIKNKSGAERPGYEPALAVGTHHAINEHKIELAFIGHVFGQMQQSPPPASGVIIGADGRAHRIKLNAFYRKLKPILRTLLGWTASPAAEPPPIILNRHCPCCLFRDECRRQAQKDDNLSLIDRMTPKLMRQYQKKGIFTINQLSYLFKPKRNRRSGKTHLHFKPELQALAIRTGKVYIQELPQLSRHAVELFFDIEGKPDQDFSYLMGLLVCEGESRIYHGFWADTPQEEERVWNELLNTAGRYPQAPIYHYGSYEPRIIARLAKKYRTRCELFKNRLVNVNAYIYGKVYFPVRSNNLKELGKFIGASWTSSEASGLQSLVWRHLWEHAAQAGRDEYKQMLLTYNEEDCRALHLLTGRLLRIAKTAESEIEIDFACGPKRNATERGGRIHAEFEQILRNARSDYSRNRLAVRRQDRASGKTGAVKKRTAYRRLVPSRAGKVVRVPMRRKCPKYRHRDGVLLKSNLKAEKILIDLRFTKNGYRKTVTRYAGAKGYCPKCHIHYNPRGIGARAKQLFGHGFQAWAVYQRIVLRLPYSAIAQAMEELFNERMTEPCIINWLRNFAEYYAATEKILIRRILESPFVHVDETRINIQGADQYVWVFTDGRHVVFKITKTREADIVHKMLSNYAGVLISDFYPGYDAVPCRQQKCWVHLIRDINEDLWDSHFDAEFESFVFGIKNLITPIFGAIDKYGLKSRHLKRFRKSVERFYETNIINKEYKSELAIKYQKRFHRHQKTLFLFLDQDSIPWNNNMAERAIRHLAIQRKISGTFFEQVALKYLRLLGIAQTCRFQEKSFFKFMLSKNKNLDQFKAAKRPRISAPIEAAQATI